MGGGKVVVRFRVAEATESRTDLAVQQTAIPSVAETKRDITVPKVLGFETRVLPGVECILGVSQRPLDAGPSELTFDTDDPILLELIVAASLTAQHAAIGVVVEGGIFGWKICTFRPRTLGRVGPNGAVKVVPVPTPAVSGMGADIAAGPGECRGCRDGSFIRLDGHVGGRSGLHGRRWAPRFTGLTRAARFGTQLRRGLEHAPCRRD